MATLTNPINSQNIVDRFNDYVKNTANSGITWGTNNVPMYGSTQVVPTSEFGGTTAGYTSSLTGSQIEGPNRTIQAAAIVNSLVQDTVRYTRIRKLQAILTVTGTGVVFDQTNVAHMSSSYEQSISTPSTSVTSGQSITTSGLEGLFSSLRSAYNAARENVVVYNATVCHSSCHSDCHGNRGRR